MQPGSGSIGKFCIKIRCCSVYSKPDYNVRIYKKAGELSNLSVFSLIIVIS